jgi:superfamily I DNA/RNA helicase
MGNYNVDVPGSVKMKFEKVLRTYIAYKRDNTLYDFTDLPLYLFDMLNLYNEEITNVDALFVDEFQDVDDVQAQIFTKVIAKKFFYIGDPRQSIYLFRGAGPQNLENLTDFTHYELNINYRSYQSIINYATAVRETGAGTSLAFVDYLIDSDIVCNRVDEPGEVYVVKDEYYTEDLVDQIEKSTYSVLSAFLMKKPYILCRTNKQVKAIEALGYKNVSTIHQAKGLEYNYVIVTDMELDTEEEINIAYVACTRAENGLLICDHEVLTRMMEDIVVEYKDDLIGGKLF